MVGRNGVWIVDDGTGRRTCFSGLRKTGRVSEVSRRRGRSRGPIENQARRLTLGRPIHYPGSVQTGEERPESPRCGRKGRCGEVGKEIPEGDIRCKE